MTPQEREAFEAIREALQACSLAIHMESALRGLAGWSGLQERVRAALALADKVSK